MEGGYFMAKAKMDIKIGEEYELLIPGYPKGSDITILNCSYIKEYVENEESGKRDLVDFMYIVFRDNKTGKKKHHIIDKPEFTFYRLKEGYQVPEYVLAFTEKDNVEPITCKYSELLKVIATLTGKLDIFYDNIRNRNSSANKALHLEPMILGSDVHIDDFYREAFRKSYTNNTFKINKGFLDIEVDGTYSILDFPPSGECPINMVSYLDAGNNVSYQFILNEKKNVLIPEYRESFKHQKAYDELRNFVIKAVGGEGMAKKYGVDKFEYKILFFDSEIELIRTLFNVVNETSPDMLLIYNMNFDLNYIIDRIVKLTDDPQEVLNIICDDRIPVKFLKYYVDINNLNNTEERGDFVKVASLIVWIDQMIHFASRRKGKHALKSNKLDDVGEIVAGVNKLDYSHITTNFKMFPYLDFKLFSYYNIIDTIVQHCIERKSQDCEYILTKALVNNTRFEKVHRQSVYLKNRFYRDYYDMGFILGNNRNIVGATTGKFPGAMVGDPTHNDKSVYIEVNGHPTHIADNLVDFDYAKLYPSIIEENNIASNTQIGKIIIDKQISNMEHTDMYTSADEEMDISRYSRGGEFLENLMCGNMLTFFKKWFNLATFKEMLSDVREFFSKFGGYGKPLDHDEAIYFTNCKEIDGIEFVSRDYSDEVSIRFNDVLDNNIKNDIIKKIEERAFI